MTAYDVFFTILAVLCAASGVLAVTTKHVAHSALWLMVSLTTLAGCYLVLGAQLVALVQLMVYVGAVIVLILVALLVTRAPIGRSDDQDTGRAHRAGAFVVSVATAALLAAVLIFSWGSGAVRLRTGSMTQLATEIFGRWVWAFEFLSVLLLLSVVAAFAMLRMRARAEEPAE